MRDKASDASATAADDDDDVGTVTVDGADEDASITVSYLA